VTHGLLTSIEEIPLRFYPADADVPAGLVTAEFTLEPLNASHVERDYDAFITSRARLNLWSGDTWPHEGFTLAENLDDLNGHDGEHRARVAFTYTVLAPDATRCLGCVYINPLERFLRGHGVPEDDRPPRVDDDALVTCWVRASAVASGLETRLVAALVDWLGREWSFQRVTFATTARFVEQQHAFEAAGLREVWSCATTPNPLQAFKLYRA
jgi:RimJ/RimL family protein N-acetyltransferase